MFFFRRQKRFYSESDSLQLCFAMYKYQVNYSLCKQKTAQCRKERGSQFLNLTTHKPWTANFLFIVYYHKCNSSLHARMVIYKSWKQNWTVKPITWEATCYLFCIKISDENIHNLDQVVLFKSLIAQLQIFSHYLKTQNILCFYKTCGKKLKFLSFFSFLSIEMQLNLRQVNLRHNVLNSLLWYDWHGENHTYLMHSIPYLDRYTPEKPSSLSGPQTYLSSPKVSSYLFMYLCDKNT